jgi:type VI secretion system protein ImpB
MSSESLQHKLDRVRRPRVQITYDVETEGAMEKKELPFVVGVLADLSAQRAEPLPVLKERSFIPIDRDNFNDVLRRAEPRLSYRVANRLTDPDSKLSVELNFRHMDDFEPARVAEQVPALKELLEVRGRLNELLARLAGKDRIVSEIENILKNMETAQALAKERGIESTPTPQPQPEESK